MANFLEALTGATTLLGGLAQILNQGAERTRKQDLLDAQLLAQLKDYEFVPADTAQPASFWQRLGGAQYKPQGTMPVITIGGKPMTLRPRQTLFDFLQSSFGPQKTAEASQPVGQQSAETATIPQAPSPSLVRTTPSSQTATLPTQATIPALPGEGAQGLQQRKQRLTATMARVVDQGQRTRILDEISKIDDEMTALNAETTSVILPQVASLPSGAPSQAPSTTPSPPIGSPSTTAPAPKTTAPSPLTPIQQRYAKALEQYGYQDAGVLVRDPAILTILQKRGASVQDFLTALNTAQTRINLQEQRRLQRQDKEAAGTKALEDERAKASKIVQDWYKEGALNDQQYQTALQMVEQAPDIPGVSRVYTRFKIAPVTAEERKRRERMEDERLTLQKQTHNETVAVRKSNAAAREEDKQYRREEREQKTIQEAREHITRLSLQKANLLKEKVPDALAGTIAYVTGTGNAKAMENLKNIMGSLQSGGDADEARKSAMEVLNQLQRHYIDQLPVTERQILHEIVGTPLVPATAPVKRVK